MEDDDETFVEGEEITLDESVDELFLEMKKINAIEDEDERLEAAKLLMSKLAEDI